MKHLWIAFAASLNLVWASGALAISPEDIVGHEREITLADALALALEYNLDLQVARTEPALSELLIDEARGAWNPAAKASYGYARDKQPTANALFFGGNASISDSWSYGGELGGLLPWGLQYASVYSLTRVEDSADFRFQALRPKWDVSWINSVTLPLLKDLYWNDVDLAVRRSYIGRDVSSEEFRRSLRETVAGVETSYWELTAARESERVAQKSLGAAKDLLEQTKVQYEVGVVSKVAVAQAEAGVAERELNEIVARNRATSAQDRLLDLILAPNIQAFETTKLLTNAPTFVAYEVDEEAALGKALERRPEIVAARKQVEDLELQLSYAWNQRLPSLDLSGSYSLRGLAGDEKPGVAPIPGLGDSSHDADDSFFDADAANSWSFGANLEYPIGNDVAQSRHTQRSIELRRTRTQLRRQEQAILIQVRGSVRELRNSIDAVKAAERRVAAQAETLRAEQERLRLGDSTPYQVLELDSDLAEAEQQEIVALQRYVNAITALEASQATLLDSRNISVVEEMGR